MYAEVSKETPFFSTRLFAHARAYLYPPPSARHPHIYSRTQLRRLVSRPTPFCPVRKGESMQPNFWK